MKKTLGISDVLKLKNQSPLVFLSGNDLRPQDAINTHEKFLAVLPVTDIQVAYESLLDVKALAGCGALDNRCLRDLTGQLGFGSFELNSGNDGEEGAVYLMQTTLADTTIEIVQARDNGETKIVQLEVNEQTKLSTMGVFKKKFSLQFEIMHTSSFSRPCVRVSTERLSTDTDRQESCCDRAQCVFFIPFAPIFLAMGLLGSPCLLNAWSQVIRSQKGTLIPLMNYLNFYGTNDQPDTVASGLQQDMPSAFGGGMFPMVQSMAAQQNMNGASPSSADSVEKLSALNDLYRQGALTNEQYEKAKESVLNM